MCKNDLQTLHLLMVYPFFLIFNFSFSPPNHQRRTARRQEARNSEERPMGVAPGNGVA
jgi:hypothetical protein